MLGNHLFRSERAAYIWRNGIIRCGVPLGAVVFLWVMVAQFGTTLDGLHTRDGWLRLGLLLLITLGEWTLGAGWLIGAALWSLQRGGLLPVRRHPHGRAARGRRPER